MNNIKIKYNNEWVLANPDYNQIYIKYKTECERYGVYELTFNNLTIYRTNNDVYNPTFIKDNNNVYPIIDFNDIKVFLLDMPNVNWYSARDYQVWAFIDFIYDNKQIKHYASKYSSHLFFRSNDTITIDIDNLPPNIIFSISRNENNSIYYEKNDSRNTRVRICDSEHARTGFLGFYRRMTSDIGMIIIPPQTNNSVIQTNNSIIIPDNLILEESSNEEEQCILCYKYKKNLTFNPCGHTISCSLCYSKLQKNECPICRSKILSLLN